MKMARKLICVLLAAMLSAMLLGGCDQDSGDSEFNIFEGYNTGETEEDTWSYYGCWEYEDYYVWVDIRDDGTYEWVDGDNASSGSYTMEEDELVLDSGLRLSC